MASGLGRELITERRIPPPDAVRVNAVRHPKTSPSALSELLGHVARSRAFKIDGNPTDRAVSGYCGLQHDGEWVSLSWAELACWWRQLGACTRRCTARASDIYCSK